MKRILGVLLICSFVVIKSAAETSTNPKEVEQPHLSAEEGVSRGVNVEDNSLWSDFGTHNVVHLMIRCFTDDGGIHHPCLLDEWKKIFGTASKNGLMNSELRCKGHPTILHRMLEQPSLFKLGSEYGERLFKMAIDHGADVNARKDGVPVLHESVCGNSAITEILIDNNVDVGAVDFDGNTALHALCSHGSTFYFDGECLQADVEKLKLFLNNNHINVDAVNFSGKTALSILDSRNLEGLSRKLVKEAYFVLFDAGANPNLIVDTETGKVACDSELCKEMRAQWEGVCKK